MSQWSSPAKTRVQVAVIMYASASNRPDRPPAPPQMSSMHPMTFPTSLPQTIASTASSTGSDTTLDSSMPTSASSVSSLSSTNSLASTDDTSNLASFTPALLDHVESLVLQRGEAAQNDRTGQLWTAVVSELLTRPQANGWQTAASHRGAVDALTRLTRAQFGQAKDSSNFASDALFAAARQYLELQQSDLIVGWAADLARQAWMRYAQQQGLRIGQQRVANAPEYPLAQPSYAPKQQQTDRRFDEGYFSESESERDDEDNAVDRGLYDDE